MLMCITGKANQLPCVGVWATVQCAEGTAQQPHFVGGGHFVCLRLQTIGHQSTWSSRWIRFDTIDMHFLVDLNVPNFTQFHIHTSNRSLRCTSNEQREAAPETAEKMYQLSSRRNWNTTMWSSQLSHWFHFHRCHLHSIAILVCYNGVIPFLIGHQLKKNQYR